MKILMMGGTRFFGIGTVKKLIAEGHDVTVATRGLTPDSFGDQIRRLKFDHRSEESFEVFAGQRYDAVIDKLAYASNDVKRVVENVSFDRYIMMSTGGVYESRGVIREDQFDAVKASLKWGERRWESCGVDGDFDYDEGKRQAECAAAVLLKPEQSVIVRYSVVVGVHDYTGRLRFYVEHTMSGKPMNITNLNAKVTYTYEDDAADFFVDVLKSDISGPVNVCSEGYLTVAEILDYIAKKTGAEAIIDENGDPAPYNCFPEDTVYSTDKARSFGFRFSSHYDWIYDLIDYYIAEYKNKLCDGGRSSN